MTDAELKTIRESLGLSVQWIANKKGVTLRTAQYWEQGRTSVPEDVVNMLEQIDKKLNSSIEKMLNQVCDMSEKRSIQKKVVLIRYRSDADLWRFKPSMKPLPATTHAAMLARLRLRLHDLNILTVIKFMEPDKYLAWLNGRKDNEAEQTAWASDF